MRTRLNQRAVGQGALTVALLALLCLAFRARPQHPDALRGGLAERGLRPFGSDDGEGDLSQDRLDDLRTLPAYRDGTRSVVELNAARAALLKAAARADGDRLETRRRAALELGRLGSDAVVALPALCETLEDEAEIVRFWAAKTLGNIGSEARQATGALLGLFGDADPNVRWEAITAIAKIDPGAITEDDWSRLLADSDPGVRQRAATIRTASL